MARLRPRVITAAEAASNRALNELPAPMAFGTDTSTTPVPKEAVQDSYAAKVIKYLPAEVVAAYLAVAGILESKDYNTTLLVFTAILTVITPMWTALAARDKDEPVQWVQTILSPFAFLVWVFAIGGPFKTFWEQYDPSIGAVALVLFSLIAPIVEKLAK